jgi:hypothetical protein
METRRLLFVVVMIAVSVSLVCASAIEMTIKELTVPSANTFPHNPAVALDGTPWYKGIMANTLQ